jgi:putative transposase
MSISFYHELRKVSPKKARELVRKVLDQNKGNVSKTSNVLGISRNSVRRARDGNLEDLCRKPNNCPSKTPDNFEKLILMEAKRTGFRYRRLSLYMRRKYSLLFSENTIKAILKRNHVKRKSRRSASGQRRHLYDYEALEPFREFQLDTKHLLDKSALPKDAYEHMKDYGLPRYEWHLMEVATRTRFTAYSHELSATYGFMFIVLVLLWLRTHGVRGQVRIRLDNGLEFCAGSQKKLDEWNKSLSVFGVTLDPIPPGAKHLLALVENAHRSDDEYFLMIHAQRCFDTLGFLEKAQRWQDTWNFYRPHGGLGMKGMTPKEKLKYTRTMVHWHVQLFPVLLLEELLRVVGTPNQFFKYLIGGKYLHTMCHVMVPLQVRLCENSSNHSFDVS